MNDLNFLSVARLEYESAADWYAERSTAVAGRFATEVETVIESIKNYPERYPRWDDRYRYCLVDGFPYYVAYWCSPGQTVIVAIRHTSQDSTAWTDR